MWKLDSFWVGRISALKWMLVDPVSSSVIWPTLKCLNQQKMVLLRASPSTYILSELCQITWHRILLHEQPWYFGTLTFHLWPCSTSSGIRMPTGGVYIYTVYMHIYIYIYIQQLKHATHWNTHVGRISVVLTTHCTRVAARDFGLSSFYPSMSSVSSSPLSSWLVLPSSSSHPPPPPCPPSQRCCSGPAPSPVARILPVHTHTNAPTHTQLGSVMGDVHLYTSSTSVTLTKLSWRTALTPPHCLTQYKKKKKKNRLLFCLQLDGDCALCCSAFLFDLTSLWNSTGGEGSLFLKFLVQSLLLAVMHTKLRYTYYL